MSNVPHFGTYSDERMTNEPADRSTEFLRLLTQHQRRIFLYVMTLVPRVPDAEEIVQETTLVLWKEFEKFQPGTHFAAWACKVAFHQVLAWRKRRQRDRLDFSAEFLEAVAREVDARGDEMERRTRALAGCVEKLPARHRDLIRLRYGEALEIEALSQRLSRTTEAIYRMLSRIREALHDCVSRSLPKEEPS
jgi:RNA polymerase sigma-70 factor, ECF subfamily